MQQIKELPCENSSERYNDHTEVIAPLTDSLALPTLEESILNGFTEVGMIGISFPYIALGGIPLSLQVRVLSGPIRTNGEPFETLPNAPFSLRLLSNCCGYGLKEALEDLPEDQPLPIACIKCNSEQKWAMESEKLSVLGNQQHALEILELACIELLQVNPLTATLYAGKIIEEIFFMHEKYLTPQWAEEAAAQVRAVRQK